MYAIEFEATIQNGVIPIPKQYLRRLQPHLKVIVLQEAPVMKKEIFTTKEKFLDSVAKHRIIALHEKNCMIESKIFFDTNLLVYLYSTDQKSSVVEKLIQSHFSEICLSVQVLNELYNVLTRKNLKTLKKGYWAMFGEIVQELHANHWLTYQREEEQWQYC